MALAEPRVVNYWEEVHTSGDSTVDVNHQKEQYSKAWVHAVASAAGMGLGEPSPDNESVDWTVYARSEDGYPRSPRLDIQVKCTSSPDIGNGVIRFVLSRKNYDDLRHDVMTRRILVVVVVPSIPADWLEQTTEFMKMRNCAYWVSIRGLPDKDNDHITVHVPLTQVFNVDSLRGIMTRLGGGGEA